MTGADETADVLAIRDLVWRFADAVNRNDKDALLSLWAPDGAWLSEPPASLDSHGIAAVGELFEMLMSQWRFFHQSAWTGPVELDGDTAKAASYMTELGVQKDGGTFRNFGRYDDTFVRHLGEWRFARRFYSFFYIDTPPLEPQFLRS